MKLGLLDAVPPKYLEITGKTDPEYFRELFAAIGVAAEMPDYRVSEGEFPPQLDTCDAYLITGSPCSVYDDLPWIRQLEEFVRGCHESRKRMVGICFGHQLIAQALGGAVRQADQGWLLGLNDFAVFESRPWMIPAQPACSLYFFNCDQVVELPAGADRLAGSALCPNVMYTLGQHILCLQPHPEHARSSIAAFLDAIQERLTPDEMAAARHSLQAGEPDAALFGQWMWRFLQGV